MRRLVTAMAVIALFALCAHAAHAEEVQLITKEDLVKLLDDPSVAIYDVRTGTDWRASGFKIKGAKRLDLEMPDTWDLPTDKKLVFY